MSFVFIVSFFLNLHVSLNAKKAQRNAHVSFEGQSRTNVSAYFPWSQACVCIKSRGMKIQNVKVSLQCFVFILCFRHGGQSNTTGDSQTNIRPEFIQHAVSILASSSRTLKNSSAESVYSDAGMPSCARLQILIDSYICDQ